MNKDFEEILDLYKSSSSDIQGDVGEVLTASRLRTDCDFKVIRNVYFPIKGKFCEIDIVAISKAGVFIIENKNYKGLVLGKKSSYNWSVLYSNSKLEKLYNPIRQNLRHRTVVEYHLKVNGYNDVRLFSPVIFNDGVCLRVKDCDKFVFSLSDFIEKYNTFDREFLSESQVDDLYKFFSRYSNCSDEMKELHKYLLRGTQDESIDC